MNGTIYVRNEKITEQCMIHTRLTLAVSPKSISCLSNFSVVRPYVVRHMKLDFYFVHEMFISLHQPVTTP